MANIDEFKKLVDQSTRDIRGTKYESDSVEQVLLNHLDKLAQNSQSSNHTKEVKKSMEAMMRFASDSIEWDSKLMKIVLDISDAHSSLLRTGSS